MRARSLGGDREALGAPVAHAALHVDHITNAQLLQDLRAHDRAETAAADHVCLARWVEVGRVILQRVQGRMNRPLDVGGVPFAETPDIDDLRR